MNTTFHEHRCYSPIHDAEMVRLSLFDKRGFEFFALIPSENGRKWRERRDKALDAIADAMQAGDVPGEIEVKP